MWGELQMYIMKIRGSARIHGAGIASRRCSTQARYNDATRGDAYVLSGGERQLVDGLGGSGHPGSRGVVMMFVYEVAGASYDERCNQRVSRG